MAKYYFCNGTTSKELPCQIHVPEERSRCHFHSGGGGPSPFKIATTVYKTTRNALDLLCYLYTLNDAIPFAIEIGREGLGLFTSLAGLSEVEPSELRDFFEKNKLEIIRRYSTMEERELRKYVAMVNHIVATIDSETDGNKTMHMSANA